MRTIAVTGAVALALVLCRGTAALPPRTLGGSVQDAAGEPVARAELHLACPAAGVDRAFVADGVGRFLATVPADAACVLTARVPGGTAVAVRELAAGEGGPLTLDVDVASYAERLDVTAPALPEAVESRPMRERFVRDAGEALALLPGFGIVRKGGIAADVVLRGQKGENLALRVDGEALHGACPNRMDPPAFHVDLAEIERIEVRRGPADVAGGGLAGSVDILTRRPEPGLHVDVLAAAGSFGALAPSASAGWGGERWSVRAGVAGRRGDAYEDGDGRPFTALLPPTAPAAYRPAARDERAFDVRTAWAGIGWTPRGGDRLELETTRQEADAQLYPYLQMDATSDDARRARLRWSTQSPGRLVEEIAASASWSRVDHAMDDRLRVSSLAAASGSSMATDARNEDRAARAEVSLARGALHARFGFEGRERSWNATTRLAMAGYRPQASLPDTTQRSSALFAELRPLRSPRLSLDGGVRVERVTSSADERLADTALYRAYHGVDATSSDATLVSGTLGLSWAASDGWQLEARLGSATRPPDTQELFFALRRMGSDWVGNPALAAPRQSELDLTLRRSGSRLDAALTAWAARLDDAVTLVDGERVAMVPGVMNRHARTYVSHDARTWGAEATARASLGSDLSLRASAAWTRGTRDLAPAKGVVDEDLPEIPPLALRLALRWERGRWYAEAEGVGAGAQRHVDAGLHEEPTPGWAVLDLRGGVALGRISLLAGVGNVFDRAGRAHLSAQRDPFRAGVAVPEPGRTLALTLRWRT